ncbi:MULTISPECIES: NAD(P)-dependent alcohol dehydrogenase [Chryseobacterium]|uniref:NAD(P)-dependent alcohol dehydrogenase n=1 Tax=Chryseobacterium TaxID=59732 RepID=UPI00195B0230|nr:MULTISPECIES: NAD(P)-dependent alcohol dehydrogenase [Chryseobacterium]MBM7421324.1 putative zinc-type alcohol dehydrogenase-like protein [Chryseobacterium sp. JUb44]MDH6211285.1 putative zinc-type alcohol dehydrogenase-like protein [Chryseobacterium sp. BIGb0186]WSO09944.1 NAD(P)-dependent alcohol dehydrogenase [Chryseobacterium scophthalmum]
MNTENIKAFGTEAPTEDLKPLSIKRREVTAKDVEIDILYCGVCHSDLHTARNEWHGTVYPNVPGHEIVGRITKVGHNVTKFKVGDLAGVGCMVDSCRECESCKEGLEQYCEVGNIQTYNGHEKYLNQQTFGGYSERVVVDEDFVLHIPENLDLAATAPLLCAGITTYSPLRHWNVGTGMKVGIVGIGGLGHMGVKIAKAMGAYVVVITTSNSKTEDAKRLGADEVILSTDEEQMKKNTGTLHFILDCVSAQHDINAYLSLLKRDGQLTLVGAPENPLPVAPFSLIPTRKSFSGSMIGGIAETQEMLDFCGKHNIVSDIEIIRMQDINNAYERLLKGDVKYRFVIDMESLKN